MGRPCVCCKCSYNLVRYAAETGEIVWKKRFNPFTGLPSGWTVTTYALHAIPDSTDLIAISAASGRTAVSRLTAEGELVWTRTDEDAETRLFFGIRRDIEGPSGYESTSMVDDGVILLSVTGFDDVGFDGGLIALATEDGEQVWRETAAGVWRVCARAGRCMAVSSASLSGYPASSTILLGDSATGFDATIASDNIKPRFAGFDADGHAVWRIVWPLTFDPSTTTLQSFASFSMLDGSPVTTHRFQVSGATFDYAASLYCVSDGERTWFARGPNSVLLRMNESSAAITTVSPPFASSQLASWSRDWSRGYLLPFRQELRGESIVWVGQDFGGELSVFGTVMTDLDGNLIWEQPYFLAGAKLGVHPGNTGALAALMIREADVFVGGVEGNCK